MNYRFVVAVAVAFASVAGAQAKPASQTGKKAASQGHMKQEATVSRDSARAIALRTMPTAKVASSKLERENGKLIWSVDLKEAGKAGFQEVNVDAMTGAVVSQQHETAKQEKAEKAERKAEKAERKSEKSEKAEKSERKDSANKAAKKP